MLYDRTSSVPHRKSSATFGNRPQSSENVRKMFGDVGQAFGTFWKIFGNLRKVVGNLRKTSKTSFWVCLYNKQNIICPLVDMNFIFSCSTRYLTRSLCSLVRYGAEHSKIYMLFTGREVRVGRNCARGLEYGLRPQAVGRTQDQRRSFFPYGPT